MFDASVYKQRRKDLKQQMKSGLILLPGNDESPMNAAENCYPFRQDSNFLYFIGPDIPGLAAVIDIDRDRTTLFGATPTMDDIIWTGPQLSIADLAAKSGIEHTGSPEELTASVAHHSARHHAIHFTPPYRAETLLKLENLTGISHRKVTQSASDDLIRAVIGLRSVKTDAEVRQIEAAIDVSRQQYTHVLKTIRPGMHEQHLAGQLTGIVNAHGRQTAFPTILTIHGETLHQRHQRHRMGENDLLLIDSGTQSSEYYASDITRTFSVGGRFSPRQKAIYEVVLKAQTAGIENTRPGVRYKDAHIAAAEAMVCGLKALDLMQGDPQEAVRKGAHALFFPHGLGHMLGLDVHDMESLGEDAVGYDDQTRRSDQFGLSSLRMGRHLKPGFVVTAEPGIYFIPLLIEKWKAENRCAEFINYTEVEKYKNFGGIRIEDDVLVTRNGCRVLSNNIPKAVDEIESILSL